MSETNQTTIEVANFSQSMPHLAATVVVTGNHARVTKRTGYASDAFFDREAIAAAKQLAAEQTASAAG